MIEVSVKVYNNSVTYSWNNPISLYSAKTLTFDFSSLDISKIPKHIWNYIFCIFMIDAITATNEDIEVSELSDNEYETLNYILQQNILSRGCAGRLITDGFTQSIKAKKYLDKTVFPKPSKTVVCANGLGKDGINVSLLSDELGYNPLCYTIWGQYLCLPNGLKISKERHKTSENFYHETGFDNLNIYTNFWEHKGTRLGFYPYSIGIAIAYAVNSDVVLDGVQIHSNRMRPDNSYYCYGETVDCFNRVGNAVGITLSNPMRALSNFGSQKLLATVWSHYLKYQRSCMFGHPWCMKCKKCNRKALYFDVLGINYNELGMSMWDKDKLKLDQYMQVLSDVSEILKKKNGALYHSWVEDANGYVLKNSWEGKKLREFYKDNGFNIYWYDIPVDSLGYRLEPSKWGEVTNV